MKYALLLVLFIAAGCSSSRMIDSYKPTLNETPELKKILVIGITSNHEARKSFEDKLQQAFKKKNIMAVQSYEFFDPLFTIYQKSEWELEQLKLILKENNYDAVLISKINRVENRITAKHAYKNFNREFHSFKDDYLSNQDIFYGDNSEQSYKVFHTETGLYHLTTKGNGELVWRGAINLHNPKNLQSTVHSYVKLLLSQLKKEDLIP
ncbi:hypothetical protein L1I30_13605 [Gillisia sp. M10.2A]|uniref:Lipoprotein n=1 Tax=Gillisia lutea TaxID=2909668 RepID=A0ABS9EMH6_9FLAO|nr:hypothetical protein [Gillisia lutea]MCF4102708.1 hypothetical protein [Gillisia lutea]